MKLPPGKGYKEARRRCLGRKVWDGEVNVFFDKDFEDAVQFFQRHLRQAALITRNPKDFPRGDIAVQTPAKFLATHFPA